MTSRQGHIFSRRLSSTPGRPAGVIGPGFNDDFGDTFGIIYGFTADGFTQRELRDYVEDVRSRLLHVKDVSKIEMIGAQEERIFIDAARGVIPEEMTRYGVQDHRKRHRRRGNGDHRIGNLIKALLLFIGKDNHSRFVGLEDGNVLDDVPGYGLRISRGADDNQRFGGQIDVLLVLDDVRRDRLVAELAEFDPDLVGCRLVLDECGDIGWFGYRNLGNCRRSSRCKACRSG